MGWSFDLNIKEIKLAALTLIKRGKKSTCLISSEMSFERSQNKNEVSLVI